MYRDRQTNVIGSGERGGLTLTRKLVERKVRKGRVVMLGTSIVVGGLVLAACGGNTAKSNAAKAPSSGSGRKVVVTLAYSSNYVFDTTPLTTQYYQGIAKQFDSKYSGATVKLEPIPGSYSDIITKLSLLYRDPNTAPDIAEMPTEQIGQFASSGYLMALNKYLARSSWWASFPKVVQSEGTFSGKVFAVNQGENDEFIYYDKKIFKEAGLPSTWVPRTWADILAAAEQIHSRVKHVYPLWLYASNLSGASGVLQGAGNLLYGTPTPYIQSPGGKWVVSSPGISATMNFYHEMYSRGLGVPLSVLPANGGIGDPTTLFAKGQLGIAIGSNYYGGSWTKLVASPYWPSAKSTIGVAPLPTEFGQKPGIATTVGGWDLAASASAKSKKYTWDLLNLMEDPSNEATAANYAGFVPPSSKLGNFGGFINFAPPFNKESVEVLPYGRLIPSASDFAAWAYGFNEATGEIALHPTTPVSAALKTFRDYVISQVGSGNVENIK